MELLKFMRTANYDKKINELEAKIEKKSTEIKNLKSELNTLISHVEEQKNQELLELLAEHNIPASKAVEIIKRAIESGEVE